MKTIIVLAMHGIPPGDFPQNELAEFFKLHSAVESMGNLVNKEVEKRYSILDKKMRAWPRDEKNDPFQAASRELASDLNEISGYDVIVGYNEFCAPGINEALQEAVDRSANKIIVATTMMTRGGEHAEKDIPLHISEFRKLYPDIEIIYAWPFDKDKVAHFLSEQISRFS
jgi:sirohydrochlorin cobaltochelatase